VSARLGLAEMIRGRHDDLLRHVLLQKTRIADETAKAGSWCAGEPSSIFPFADNQDDAEGMAYVEKFVARWKGHDLIIPAIAPHAPYTVSEEHLKAARAFFRSHGRARS
jgi:5-methylthioadenosine/S-adenosylhomocysteine deaminase